MVFDLKLKNNAMWLKYKDALKLRIAKTNKGRHFVYPCCWFSKLVTTLFYWLKHCHPESEFAYGRNEESPDSEQIELTMPKGITAKLCERGANSRRI